MRRETQEEGYSKEELTGGKDVGRDQSSSFEMKR